jgi:DNA-directed RNA polymerase specialized sigma24 family protein
MDEVYEFCRRVLGAGATADEAAAEALAEPGRGRVELLAVAARACRARADAAPVTNGAPVSGHTLAESVALEVAEAVARLPERHREALALREALRLSHDQIAAVMDLDPAAVAPLLARARLQLREERRHTPLASATCRDRDRSLRALARRLDSEPLTADDDEWLFVHLGACEECAQAHAAMVEASVCYRAASGVTFHGSTAGSHSE